MTESATPAPEPPAPEAVLLGEAPQPPRNRVEIVIGLRTLLPITAFICLVALTLLSLGTLLSIFIAAILALGLDPVVGGLVNRGWNRGKAALVVFTGLLVGVAAIVLFAAGPVWQEIVKFVQMIPTYWEEISSTPVFEAIISEAGAEGVRKALADLAAGFPEAATTLLGIAAGVVGTGLSMVTLGFLALFLLMERPTIADWLFGFTPPATEDRWRPVMDESISAISSSLIGNVAISLVAALVAGISAWALGMPFPIVLAVITGLLDLIPQVGATIAAILLVAVALTVSTPAALIMMVIQIVYQQLENYVVYPIVYRRAVELSALTTIGAVLIASSILGVAGAILAVPFAAVIKVILHESSSPRRERMAALRDTAPERTTTS